MPSPRERENLFTGRIGEEYHMLMLLCPNAAALAEKLGRELAAWRPGETLHGIEIGCGTGVSTLAILNERSELKLTAIDSAPAMLLQARENLGRYVDAERLELVETDALAFLQAQNDASVDTIVSNYAIHNFTQHYRSAFLAQILRVLKPGGLFLNGDRYAIDECAEHLAHNQSMLRHWFKVFGEMKRYDLLEDWVAHLMSDESADHVMRYNPSIHELKALGFSPVETLFRDGVDTLVKAVKPV
jgi:tRNA (cmo5U34)-methyltransferase